MSGTGTNGGTAEALTRHMLIGGRPVWVATDVNGVEFADAPDHVAVPMWHASWRWPAGSKR
jgi:hypothetical protein